MGAPVQDCSRAKDGCAVTPRHAAIEADGWLMILDEVCDAFEQVGRSFVARDPWVDAAGLAGQISRHEDLCDRQSNALRWLDQLSFKIIQEPSRLSVEEIETYFRSREAVVGIYCNVDC